MKINIGSGIKRIPGYLNIDNDSKAKPDFVLDLESDILPFEDNTIDHVIAHHILEHLGDGFFHCFKELYRVCKHNTLIDIRVPHPRHDCYIIDPTHKRPIYPLTLNMFSKEFNRECLRNNSGETPLGLIYDIDFILENHTFTIDPYWREQFQNFTEEQCEHAARSFNNVIVEIGIQLKVNKDERSTGNG